MEIRVAVPDTASAKAPVQRLAGVFDPTAVMLDADSSDVSVHTGQHAGQTVAQILDAVEDWLDEGRGRGGDGLARRTLAHARPAARLAAGEGERVLPSGE